MASQKKKGHTQLCIESRNYLKNMVGSDRDVTRWKTVALFFLLEAIILVIAFGIE